MDYLELRGPTLVTKKFNCYEMYKSKKYKRCKNLLYKN